MKPQVQGALAEWLAGLIIGVIPLMAHAITHFSVVVEPPRPETSWIGELDFIVISTSGASLVSIVKRLIEGALDAKGIGKSLIALSALTVLLLVAAAILYGAVSTRVERDYAIWEGLGLLLGSVVTSIYCEMTLASRIS